MVSGGPLDLKVDQTVERNRCGDLALDVGIDFADIASHHGNKPQGTTGIAPGQATWDADGSALSGPGIAGNGWG